MKHYPKGKGQCHWCDAVEAQYNDFIAFHGTSACPEHEADLNAYIDTYAAWLNEKAGFNNRLWIATEVFERIARDIWRKENPEPTL
jgi:hypothetical protein